MSDKQADSGAELTNFVQGLLQQMQVSTLRAGVQRCCSYDSMSIGDNCTTMQAVAPVSRVRLGLPRGQCLTDRHSLHLVGGHAGWGGVLRRLHHGAGRGPGLAVPLTCASSMAYLPAGSLPDNVRERGHVSIMRTSTVCAAVC